MNSNNDMRSDHADMVKDNELDIVDILASLWAGKKIIISTIIVILLIAVAWIFFSKQKWTSTAIVTQPSAGQVANYNTALTVLFSQNQEDKIALSTLQGQLFDRFSASMSALSNSLQNLEEPEILKVIPNTVGKDDPINITFVGQSAKDAQEQLKKFIVDVNKKVVSDYTSDIKYNLSVKKNEFSDLISAQEAIAEKQKKQRVDAIKMALKIAQSSNIVDSRLTQADMLSDDTLSLLGTKALSAMVENENSKPLVFDDDYYNTQRALLTMENLNIDLNNLQSFRYIMSPDLPIRRDSPKRGLTLVLAVIFGGVLGSSIVVGRNMIYSYRRRKNINITEI
jgi:chain length determinant protein (polysaccharide antigen chain regulator)